MSQPTKPFKTAVAAVAAAASISAIASGAARVASREPPRTASPAEALQARAESPAAPASAGSPAVWIPHDVMVVYRNLPRAYSCDALWYKVGDMLRAAGAWKSVSITPYDCKPDTHTDGRSPQLEVRFLTLRTVSPQQARWADTHAVPATVTLEPGHPKSLDRGDCELLRQTNVRLLSLVQDLRVVGQSLDCTGHPPSGTFSLSVETLQEVPPQSGRAG